MRKISAALCGHFNKHWTVVTDVEGGTTSRQYCADCGHCLRTITGQAAAEHMWRKARQK